MSNNDIKVEEPADDVRNIVSAADIQAYSVSAETRSFKYEPQADITAYELALLMPMIVNVAVPYGQYAQEYDRLPPEAKRHWVVTK